LRSQLSGKPNSPMSHNMRSDLCDDSADRTAGPGDH
jgi:hypothetical protein